jgi:hypothetical protein
MFAVTTGSPARCQPARTTTAGTNPPAWRCAASAGNSDSGSALTQASTRAVDHAEAALVLEHRLQAAAGFNRARDLLAYRAAQFF